MERSSTPLLGYRCWRVVRLPGGPQLRSVFRDTVWDSRELVAECLAATVSHVSQPCALGQPPHIPPRSQGLCGVYAYHDARRAREHLRTHRNHSVVVGAIVGLGKVCIHREGWRAERGRAVVLARSKITSAPGSLQIEDYQQLADRYGVLLVDMEHLEAAAGEFGIIRRPQCP